MGSTTDVAAASGGARVWMAHDVADILARVQTISCPPVRWSEANSKDPFGFEEEPEEEYTAAELAEIVMESTGGQEKWERSESTIAGTEGKLIVEATPEIQRAVQRFLDRLRS